MENNQQQECNDTNIQDKQSQSKQNENSDAKQLQDTFEVEQKLLEEKIQLERKMNKQIPQTSFTLITTMLGSSLLAFPFITDRIGFVLTIVLLLHSIISMLWCMKYYIDACYYTKAASYKDMVREISGKILGYFIDGSITVQCFGFMVSYVVISSNSILQVIQSYSTSIDTQNTLTRTIVKICVGVVIFPLTLLKRLNGLNKISAVANIIILVYCISIIVYFGMAKSNGDCLCQYEENGIQQKITTHLNTWPKMSALNGFLIFISYVPSIHSNFSAHPVACRFLNELQGPYFYRKSLISKSIIISCITVLICLSISGFFGASLFGDSIQQNILVAFQPSILYACVVIISFPLQLYPVKMSIISYFNQNFSEKKEYIWTIILDLVFLILAVLLACVLESIVTILSIASSIAGILYFFVIPILCFIINKELKKARESFVADQIQDQQELNVENLATAAISMILPIADKESINRIRAASQFFVQNKLVKRDSEYSQPNDKVVNIDVVQQDGTVKQVEYVKRSQSLVQVLTRKQSLQEYRQSLTQYQQQQQLQQSTIEIARQAVLEADTEIQDTQQQVTEQKQKVEEQIKPQPVNGLFKSSSKQRRIIGIILMCIYTIICLEGVVMNIIDMVNQ